MSPMIASRSSRSVCKHQCRSAISCALIRTTEAEEMAAKKAGLAYIHLPVTSSGITKDDARRFQEAIDASPGPVVAHCRSGVRSFFLCIMTGDLESKRDDEVLALAEQLHLDPKAVAGSARGLKTSPLLEKNHDRHR